jgi:hypothetical protein
VLAGTVCRERRRRRRPRNKGRVGMAALLFREGSLEEQRKLVGLKKHMGMKTRLATTPMHAGQIHQEVDRDIATALDLATTCSEACARVVYFGQPF